MVLKEERALLLLMGLLNDWQEQTFSAAAERTSGGRVHALEIGWIGSAAKVSLVGKQSTC